MYTETKPPDIVFIVVPDLLIRLAEPIVLPPVDKSAGYDCQNLAGDAPLTLHQQANRLANALLNRSGSQYDNP